MTTKHKDKYFKISEYYGDNEFEHFHNFLASANLHTCNVNEHIRDIKRSIQTIKERVRCVCHSTPYKKFIKIMTRYLVQDMITCLNMFPSNSGITSDLIPAAITLGSPNIYYNKLMVRFGAYVQVYIGTTNNTKQRTVETTTLRT